VAAPIRVSHTHVHAIRLAGGYEALVARDVAAWDAAARAQEIDAAERDCLDVEQVSG